MRMSLWLAAMALCLGAGSSAAAPVSISASNSPSRPAATFSPIGMVSNAAAAQPVRHVQFRQFVVHAPTQATYPKPRRHGRPDQIVQPAPDRQHESIASNTHYIGYSIFPTQTDQYLAQFGYQRLR